MLTGAFIFLIIAIVAGYLGYKQTDLTSMRNAKRIFYISSIIFLILILTYFLQPSPSAPGIPINPLQ